MIKIILLNHETGVFYEAYSTEHITDQIATEVANGADIENLSVYRAETLEIVALPVEKYIYKLRNKNEATNPL